MGEDIPLKVFFEKLMQTIDGVHCIAVTDSEGIPLVIAKDDKIPAELAKPELFSSAYTTFDQTDKLEFGSSNYIVAYFTKYQLICFNKRPIYVSIIADKDEITGQILNLEKEFNKIINSINMSLYSHDGHAIA